MTIGLSASEWALVRRAGIFRGLPEETLEKLISDANAITYAAGTMLFLQGEPAAAFFVVLDGWVKVYRMTASGEEAVVGIFTRGESFADAAAFTSGTYPATGGTVTKARVLRVPSQHLRERIMESPEIGLAMLASTSMHLHSLIRQIEQLKAHTGAQRVAEFILSLLPEAPEPVTIALPYDKALLAGKLGLKPESLSRAFQRLRQCGVHIKRELAIVDDVAILRDFVHQERAKIMRSKSDTPVN